MDKIICFINMFAAKARAYHLDSEDNQTLISEIPVDQLSYGLAAISAEKNINNITLIGAPDYADALVPEILEYAKLNFSNNDLIVEVMK